MVVMCSELAERVLNAATGTCARTRCTRTRPSSPSSVQEPRWRKRLGTSIAHEPCAVVDRMAAVEDVAVGVVSHGECVSSLLGLGVVVVWVLARVGLVWMVGMWV